jgi:hypothetical protein
LGDILQHATQEFFCTAVRLLAQHRKLLYLPGNSAALAIGILHDQVYVEHGQKAAA